MNKKILQVIVDAITGPKVEWEREWTPGKGARNAKTLKEYRGANTYLNLVGDYFLTFRQLTELGGKVKKGASSYPVVFAMFGEKDDEEDAFLGHRYYNVFDIRDVEGIKQPKDTEKKWDTLEVLEAYLKREKIKMCKGEPAYNALKDTITMPKTVKTKHGWNSILAHEIAHSTGHEKRLNRFGEWKGEVFLDKKNYAREELVAEITSMLLTGNKKNNTAYIQYWLGKLKEEDRRMEIYKSFQLAQSSFDFITIGKPKK